MSRASDESVFTCVDCFKEFEEKQVMDVHLKAVHNWTDEEVACGEKEYEVEEIISHRYDRKNKQYMYTVKWKGYDDPSEIAKDGFGEESSMLAEYKLNNMLDDSMPPNKKRKSKAAEEPEANEENGSRRLRGRSEGTSPSTPSTSAVKNRAKDKPIEAKKKATKHDDESQFVKKHKMIKVLGYKSSPEDGILFLVEFDQKEDETRDEVCRLVTADDMWKKKPDMLRAFFEKHLLTVNSDSTSAE